MFFSVATHNDAKNSKGFINYDDVEFADIPKMVMSGYAYSAGRFKDNHRKNDNWEGCEDVLILDIDDGCTIKQAMSIFSKYQHYIITSRSHKKEKNGIVCDRFRIFIRLETTINDSIIRDTFMAQVMSIYNFVDRSCSDRGRFFFSSPENAEVYYTEGKNMPVIIIETPLHAIKEVKAINVPSDDIYRLDELKNIWIDKNGNELESGYSEDGVNYEAKLKGAMSLLDREFYSGNRNNALFGCMAMLKNDRLNGDDIVNFAISENDKRGGVALRELMAIWKSVERLS